MVQSDLRSARWRRQFVYGFVLAGEIISRDTFPAGHRMAKKSSTNTQNLPEAAPPRFPGVSSQFGLKECRDSPEGTRWPEGKG